VPYRHADADAHLYFGVPTYSAKHSARPRRQAVGSSSPNANIEPRRGHSSDERCSRRQARQDLIERRRTVDLDSKTRSRLIRTHWDSVGEPHAVKSSEASDILDLGRVALGGGETCCPPFSD
jgi:hypothetical protein